MRESVRAGRSWGCAAAARITSQKAPECIVTYYGFPVVSEYGNKFLGYTRLYFKSVVKVTEDFISYDLLR